MSFATWCIIAGAVLIFMAVAGSVLKRLPLSASVLYLAFGLALGPALMNAVELDLIRESETIERLTEIAVLISLFSAGLKLRIPLNNWRWALPVRLATVSMVATVAGIAAVGVYLLDLPLGAAILLGAILAPTDPVLASDVQVTDAYDRDHLRFGLTGEAGMNDGSAFPFVMLGLGLLGLHELGPWGTRWVGMDLMWALAAGVAVGAASGWTIALFVLYLRRHHREAVGLDDFLALGLIAVAYGAALAISAYGFLAVFAAGVALRRVEMEETGEPAAPPAEAKAQEEAAIHPDTAPAFMAQAVLAFNEHLERIAEVVVVVTIGCLLHRVVLDWKTVALVAVLLFVIRPVSVVLGTMGTQVTRTRTALIAWFGIRGVGSLYYLCYAITHGLTGHDAQVLVNCTLVAIATSVVLHGISVTPVMDVYARRRQRRPA